MSFAGFVPHHSKLFSDQDPHNSCSYRSNPGATFLLSVVSVMFRIIACAKSVLTAQVAKTRIIVMRKVLATRSAPARKTICVCAGTMMKAMSSASGPMLRKEVTILKARCLRKR